MNERELLELDRETKCETCGQTLGWHFEHKPKHDFVPPGGADQLMVGGKEVQDGGRPKFDPRAIKERARDSLRSQDEAARSRVSRLPSDPVLRQALVDAGVITPDDLQTAAAKIAAISGQLAEAPLAEPHGG